MKTLINTIIQTSSEVKTPRTNHSVLAHIIEEVGEVATEINIDAGLSYKDPSPDGIIGEAVDSIISLVDLIYIHAKSQGVEITEEDLISIATAKLNKWKKSVAQR